MGAATTPPERPKKRLVLRHSGAAFWARLLVLGSFLHGDSQRRGAFAATSSSHCFGTNPGDFPQEKDRQQERDFLYNSCMYHNICYDNGSHDWVMYVGEGSEHLRASPKMVSVGSVNPKWTFKQGIGANRLRFLPRLVPSQLPETEAGFRWASDVPELREFVSTSTDPALHLQPNNVTWVLFHSMAAFNFGHMLWDDLLPVFYLSKLFGLSMADSPPKDGAMHPTQALPLRHAVQDGQEPLWASCAFRDAASICDTFYSKWLSGLGLRSNATPPFASELAGDHSTITCFPWLVAGMGMLSDHGTHLHGWRQVDYNFQNTHNGNRGALIYEFASAIRKHMLDPSRGLVQQDTSIEGVKVIAGMGPTDASVRLRLPARPRRQILFLSRTSRHKSRRIAFEPFAKAIAKRVNEKGWDVLEVSSVSSLAAVAQVYLASTSSILVMACGGASAIGTFLPRGGTAVLYHSWDDVPQYLDWDIYAHMSHIQTAWLTSPSLLPRDGYERRFESLATVIEREMERIEHFISFESAPPGTWSEGRGAAT